MKKQIILWSLTVLLVACGGGNSNSTEEIIASKNVDAIKNKRAALQAEITKLDAALSSLEKKVSESLVEVSAVQDTIFKHYIELQGNVTTQENVLVQPEVPGVLVSLNVKAGQRVSKGQILGRVDDGGASEGIAALESQYALAKTTFERQKNLWDKRIGSEIQFLNAQTQMVSAQKSLNQARAQLAKTVIRAPFSGTIDEVFVEKGEVVSASPQGLMRIVNLGKMYVNTTVPEIYVGKIKVGTPVDITIEGTGKTYSGKVRQIANSVNPENRSFGVEIALPNDNMLRPNQVAKLRIIDYTNKSAIVVPSNVVLDDADGKKYVFIADKISGNSGIAKRVFVEVGQSAGNLTEIISGLTADQKVVTEGASNISEGMKLTF
ncbi:efflux RND transporter periplasmic adaptor subunit [Flavobacterium sp.]|uniref:efflux RND transporter periplasmic adaptor subunit n=1 Tax=Flavobacterium sp. TaxID=239 RepID=UPI003B9BF919